MSDGAAPPSVFERLENLEVKLSRTRSWSGLETEPVYGPTSADTRDFDSIGEPGEYPYTRGAYPKMYRSRMWTLRNIVGYGAPEDTREGIEKVLAQGGNGINVVTDPLTGQGIDPDHPSFGPEVGLDGVSLPLARDMETLLSGIDLAKVDTAWHWTTMAYPMAAAVHLRRGQPLSTLLGSNMPDMLQQTLSGWGQDLVPAELGHRTTVSEIEFCVRESPKWALGMPQAYDMRERGLTPAGELAVGMAIVNQTMTDLAALGTSIDIAAASIAWVSIADIDFFEEVAKFRALRRFWARTMRDRFGVTDPRALRLRIACHTSGNSLVARQPLNNLTRTAIQSFAALCGGVQSLEACTFDEPIGVPTHESRDLAIRQQQILAHEVGAARVADPLGGSWYVEELTDRIEQQATELLARIEKIGVIEAIRGGSIEAMMDEHNALIARELETHERVIVGVNEACDIDVEPTPRFTFDSANTAAHIRRFREIKEQRDQARWSSSLRHLHHVSKARHNPLQAMIDAFMADASVGEIWGTVRVANGYRYDPYGAVEDPIVYG